MRAKFIVMTATLAATAVWRNRLRSVLTMLGVIFGVAAVIAMVSVGEGANRFVQAQIASLGTNILFVIPGAITSGGARSGWGMRSTLTVADAQAIQREAPSVLAVSYANRGVAQVVFGRKNWRTAVQGTTPGYLGVRDWPLASGRFFNEHDEKGAARVCVLGKTVLEELFFPGQDPVGATIRIGNVPFRVIGTLAAKGQTSWGQDQDDVVLMPFSTAERKVLGREILGTVQFIYVKARSSQVLDRAQAEIERILRRTHNIGDREEDDFAVRGLGEIASASQAAGKVMTRLLAAIASISLLVGGIGIMNILLVSVTERTREIGLRMAVGAKSRDILTQFLVEAAVISGSGGLIGVILGFAVTRVVETVTEWPVVFVPASAAAALVFAAAVGIFFGYYPAHRASRLDPIEALRFE